MKIRTITAGIDLSYPVDKETILETADFLQQAKQCFQEAGYEVQTVRFSTRPWEGYLGGLAEEELIAEVLGMEEAALDAGVDFMNIGTAYEPENIKRLPEIIKQTKRVSLSTTIAHRERGGEIDHAAARETARAILKISKETEGGMGNFNFAATANCQPGIPFFPASYHQGPPCFALGLECGDLVHQAFQETGDLHRAPAELKRVFEEALKPLEKMGKELEEKSGRAYKGIDVSTAPTLDKDRSLAFGFEELGLGKFGGPGTLAVTGMITRVLKGLDIKKCGYSGVMLPILEDFGLAERCAEGLFDIDNVLLYSAVCGTGLDCIPLPGDVSWEKLYAILIDMATLALALDKPLSARLFPVPGRVSGELTDFDSPYLVNTRVMRVK